jgi:hypothetical protein
MDTRRIPVGWDFTYVAAESMLVQAEEAAA